MIVQLVQKILNVAVLSLTQQRMIRLFIATLVLNFILLQPIYSKNYKVKLIKILTKNDINKNLSLPTAIFYNKNDEQLYVIDSPRKRIIVYNVNFFPFFSVGEGRGIFSPVAIATNENNIFVCQSKSPLNNQPKITVFSNAWIKTKEILLNFRSFLPKTITISQKGNIFIIDKKIRGVIILNHSGNFVRILKVKEKKDVLLSDIYIDDNNRIYLLSEETGKVYIYSKKHKLILKAGVKGGTPGKLSRPRGVAADPYKGFIYIVDYMRQIIQILDYKTGEYVFEFGGYGTGPGYFNFPTDISVDNRGLIYVADMFNHRIQVFKILCNQ